MATVCDEDFISDGFDVSDGLVLALGKTLPFKSVAHIRESADNERYVIWVGNKYVGYSRDLAKAVVKAKHAMARQVMCEYVGESGEPFG